MSDLAEVEGTGTGTGVGTDAVTPGVEAGQAPAGEFRSGFAALVGRPNVASPRC
jgi:hypothetical protein